jgi:hypothetical protein
MPDRYPGYDVLAKRDSLSWNAKTREIIEKRLKIEDKPGFFSAEEYQTLRVVADRIVPQPVARPQVPVAALVDSKLQADKQDGYRAPDMPRQREAWRRGLRALDAESQTAYGARFVELTTNQQDALLDRMQRGDMHDAAWEEMKPENFWRQRMARDIVFAYWSHPIAWNEIGWGGPASPRGYVRTGYDERDPWEPAEAVEGQEDQALLRNRHVG